MFIDDTTLIHFKDGKPVLYEVDPELAKALNASDRASISDLVKMLALPANVLRTGAILNPAFMERNFQRDTLSAFLFSKDGFIPVIDTLRGIGMIVGKTNMYKEWVASGGMFAHMQAIDQAYLQKGIKDVISKIPLRNEITSPIAMLRAASALVEQGTRVSVFARRFKKAQKKEGKSRIDASVEAGFESRDVTLDFQRFGAKTRSINQLSVFFNAFLQGPDKAVRAWKERPVATTVRAMLGITIPSVALHLVNRDEDWYKKLPQWRRDLYWHINVGTAENPTIFVISKPFQVGTIFGTGAENMIEWAIGEDPSAAKDFLDSFSRSMVPNVIPTIMGVPMEIWANRSVFFDRPIIPHSREKLLPEAQYSVHTTELAKKIARAIGYIPGAELTPMASPAVIEHIVRGWSGGLGTLTMKLLDDALHAVGVFESFVKPKDTLADIPLIRAFIHRHPSMSTRTIERFYEEAAIADKYDNTIKAMIKEGKRGAVNRLIQKQRENGYLFKLKSQRKAIRNMTRLVRKIYRLPSHTDPHTGIKMTDDELALWKRESIDTLYVRINQVADAGVKMIDHFRKLLDEK
jgi:hypothetical protein